MEKMSKKKLLLPAAIAGVVAAVVNLAAEWLLNHTLVVDDYIASAVVGVLTPLAIFILLRNRSGKNGGQFLKISKAPYREKVGGPFLL